MSKKKINSLSGLVYSTDPNFKIETEDINEQQTLLPAQQKLKVVLDKKNRAGKAVTLVEGFIGTTLDREDLGKKLKSFCGTGGSVKDDTIIIQGDNRDKLLLWFQKNGFTSVKKIG